MPTPVRTRRLLRAALTALLVLGMVIGPTLAVASGLHGIEHAALAAHGTGHGHGHAGDAGHHHHADDPSADEADPEHATGAHGLLHQTGSVSVALPHAVLSVCAPAACAPQLPELRRPSLPGDSPTLPFRPPIA